MRVLIVCVSYKTEEESVRFIQSLYETKQAPVIEVILVNNSAINDDDDTFDSIAKKYPGLKVMNRPENLGYFGAAQAALATVDKAKYDWVVVSNVDIVIEDKDIFEKLSAYQANDQIGVLAPAVISLLSNKDTNPFMIKRPNHARMQFYKTVFSNYVTCQIYHLASLAMTFLKKPFSKTQINLSDKSIYAAHGAFFIFSKYFFKKGGNFNFQTYMYGEEIFIAEQCRQLHLNTMYVPKLKVIHTERASTGLFYSRKTLSWKKHSSQYLAKAFFTHE